MQLLNYNPGPGFSRSSGYGPRDAGFHNGVDYSANRGTEIHAAEAGRVVYAGTDPKYGEVVILECRMQDGEYFKHS